MNVFHARFLFLIVSLIGGLLIYWHWPHGEHLPILDEVEPFQLKEFNGEMYQSDNQKVKLLTFYYTKCPDVCPLTMIDLSTLQEGLKKNGIFGQNVELVSITLDPENDTSPIIGNYSKLFNADTTGWKWLRGTTAQTEQLTKNLKIQSQKLDDGFLSHSTTMYLIDHNSKIRALYHMANPNEKVDTEKILKDILILINET